MCRVFSASTLIVMKAEKKSQKIWQSLSENFMAGLMIFTPFAFR